MTWDGNERRGSSHIGEDIAVIKERLFALDKRINGTIGSIEKHLEELENNGSGAAYCVDNGSGKLQRPEHVAGIPCMSRPRSNRLSRQGLRHALHTDAGERQHSSGD